MLSLELHWPLEECLSQHCEEFCGVDGTVSVEQRLRATLDCTLVLLNCGLERACPRALLLCRVERRCPVEMSLFEI
jgi:hypothetical protein